MGDVDPRPDATPAEGPGSFRQHEIEEFPRSVFVRMTAETYHAAGLRWGTAISKFHEDRGNLALKAPIW